LLAAAADERAFVWHAPPMPHAPQIHRWYCTASWQRRRAVSALGQLPSPCAPNATTG
jgi:hypothetical protein